MPIVDDGDGVNQARRAGPDVELLDIVSGQRRIRTGLNLAGFPKPTLSDRVDDAAVCSSSDVVADHTVRQKSFKSMTVQQGVAGRSCVRNVGFEFETSLQVDAIVASLGTAPLS